MARITASLLSDLMHGQLWSSAIGYSVANLTHPLLGALLLRRVASPRFDRLPDIAAPAAVQGAVAAPLASVIGARVNEWWPLNPPGFLISWRTWWVGNFVGALVLTPVVFRVRREWRTLRRMSANRWLEVTAFLSLLVVATQVIFRAPPGSLMSPLLLFPVLLLASVRFGLPGVGAALT